MATKTTSKHRTKPATRAPARKSKKAAKPAAVATKAAVKAPAVKAPAAKPPAAKPPAAKPAAAQAAAPAAAPSTAPQQQALASVRKYFDRTLSAFDEADSTFAPTPAMFTVAQHVAHTAQTVDWFLEGAFRPEGFAMDFPGLELKAREVTSLARAKTWLEEAFGRMLTALKDRPAASWHAPIAKDTIMGGAPRVSIVEGLADHTAHHRGALTVYARLRGKVPPMPYG